MKPDDSLTPAEFESLKEVNGSSLQRKIPAAHEAKLAKMGLVEQKLGGLVRTREGTRRVVLGK